MAARIKLITSHAIEISVERFPNDQAAGFAAVGRQFLDLAFHRFAYACFDFRAPV